MPAEENKALMRRFIATVINSGDLDALDDLVAEDYVEHTAPPGVPPDREGLLGRLAMLHEAFPDLHSEEISVIAEDDMVVFHGIISGTHRGEFMGMPPTGNRFEILEMHVERVRDGEFTEHWGLFDTMTMM
jgi:predicted ester cyclase